MGKDHEFGCARSRHNVAYYSVAYHALAQLRLKSDGVLSACWLARRIGGFTAGHLHHDCCAALQKGEHSIDRAYCGQSAMKPIDGYFLIKPEEREEKVGSRK